LSIRLEEVENLEWERAGCAEAPADSAIAAVSVIANAFMTSP
jgi:hypothetical protein